MNSCTDAISPFIFMVRDDHEEAEDEVEQDGSWDNVEDAPVDIDPEDLAGIGAFAVMTRRL